MTIQTLKFVSFSISNNNSPSSTAFARDFLSSEFKYSDPATYLYET